MPVEVYVMDAGSNDESLDIISSYEDRLAGWRSYRDAGQAAAINEGIARGSAPYVCWLNSDDFFYPGGLERLLTGLCNSNGRSFAYGKCWTVRKDGTRIMPYLTTQFHPRLFANFCFIAQPGTLITRRAWEEVGGLDSDMHMAFDYDLWWRLYRHCGAPVYVRNYVAATRMHRETKTATQVDLHYSESRDLVQRHWGATPVKWRMMLPVMKVIRRVTNLGSS